MDRADTGAREPPRTDAVPGSYAIEVNSESIHVWEYRVTASAREGRWQFVESLDRDANPSLSLDYARLTSGTGRGYWIYSRSYDCKTDCT
ncbi:MAG: hypothetical protein ABEJ61_10845 [Haloferacaceae archaeon]